VVEASKVKGLPEEHVLNTEGIDTSKSHLLFDKDYDRMCATITLNRPEKLNAVTKVDLYRLLEIIAEVEVDDGIKSLVMKGAGPCLSSGADVAFLGGYHGIRTPTPGEKIRRSPERDRLTADRFFFQGLYEKWAKCLKVTICQGHSYVEGIACWFALLSDITIISEDAVIGHSAYRMTGPSVDGLIGYWILKIGTAKTKEILITGRYLEAQEALRCGLVNEVVPRDKLEERVGQWVEAISLQPLDGIVAGKAAFDIHMNMLGVGNCISVAYPLHTITTSMRFEPDEFSFLKARRDVGMKEAFKERDEKFNRIPGFEVIKRPIK
jgi:enoyl-CoA hydratase